MLLMVAIVMVQNGFPVNGNKLTPPTSVFLQGTCKKNKNDYLTSHLNIPYPLNRIAPAHEVAQSQTLCVWMMHV